MTTRYMTTATAGPTHRDGKLLPPTRPAQELDGHWIDPHRWRLVAVVPVYEGSLQAIWYWEIEFPTNS